MIINYIIYDSLLGEILRHYTLAKLKAQYFKPSSKTCNECPHQFDLKFMLENQNPDSLSSKPVLFREPDNNVIRVKSMQLIRWCTDLKHYLSTLNQTDPPLKTSYVRVEFDLQPHPENPT